MKDRLSIVFLGTSAFAVPCLKALATDPAFRVQLVITQPDRPTGRKQELKAPPVKEEALRLGLPIEQPEKLTELASKPDFLVVVSYGQILPDTVLNAAKIAPLNVHASLLPKLRGASPIQHTILLGLPDGGVTVQKMVQELDAGPVLCQRAMPVSERETFTTLHDKLAVMGAELLIDALKNEHKPVEQDPLQATFCKKLKKSDGEADPKIMPAQKIDRMVRALTPWPGVSWNGTKILETALQENVRGFPLPCAEGTLLCVTRIQPAGGKPMDGVSFLRGRPDVLR